MKRILPSLSVILALLLAGYACKKKRGPGEDGPGPAEPNSRSVQVNLPAGSTYDLSGAQLLSLGKPFNVGKNGETYVQDIGKEIQIAYIYDKDDNPVLAGFISDSATAITPASTAKVLLYFAAGLPFRPDTIRNVYIHRVHELAAANEFFATFTELWKKDPLVMSKGTFAASLKKAVDALNPTCNNNVVDINARTSDIVVDESGFVSGVQVFEESLGKIAFNNNSRRRAHAFLYKMTTKFESGRVTNHITGFNNSIQSNFNIAVDPAAANTSVTGQAGAWIEGKWDDIAMAKSGPLALDIADDELEQIWAVRVVGPGIPSGKLPVTAEEIKKYNRLIVETFAMDYMLPVIMEALGWKEELGNVGINVGDEGVAAFIDATEVFIKAVPDAYEQIKKGEYTAAAKNCFMAFATNTLDKGMEHIVTAASTVCLRALLKATGNKPVAGIGDYNAAAKKVLKFLKAVNTGMQIIDWARISYAYATSQTLDEWEVKARSSQVKLIPREAMVVPLEQVKITAEVKNLVETGGDTHPFFEWKSTGKYGYLKDTKGNEGPAFNSADNIVFFNCNVDADKLSDGDNWEYVYVIAKLQNKEIGRDTMKINVKKIRYKMVPDGVTLSGKDGEQSEVALYLRRVDGKNDIQPNNDIDYKVVWSTAGRHGSLHGKDIDYVKTVTEYNAAAIAYSCTDDETKESTETITARIYSKLKTSDTYRLLDEVKGTIKINNDEKKRIIHRTLEYYSDCWTKGNCFTYPLVKFPVDEKAKSYSVRFYNFTGTANYSDNQYVYSWATGQHPPTYYSVFYETKDIQGGNYHISLGRTWCAGPESGCNQGSTGAWEARYKELYGPRVMAEITYFY